MEKVPEVSSLQVSLHTVNKYGIWTGGAKAGEMDTVNATSILGGLRFWTAALLRANGKEVRDAQCQYTPKGDSACSLCRIFGCTGLARSFSFSTATDSEGLQGVHRKGNLKPPLELKWHKRPDKPRPPTYYLTQGYTGPIALSLAARRPLLDSGHLALPAEMTTALYLMIKYGTMGAYDQYGCGLVRFSNSNEESTLRNLCLSQASGGAPAAGTSLRDFFFFKGRVDKHKARIMLGEIRWQIREAVRNADPGNAKLRHWFCGSLGGGDNAFGTNYAFTVNADGSLYGWGHFATSGEKGQYAGHRDMVLDCVFNVLSQSDIAGKTLVWRECDSVRDTVKRMQWPEFYTDLVQGNWRDA